MPSLHEQLREDLKAAMRAGETVRRDTIRMVEAAIKNAEIERRQELGDSDILQVVQKQIKLRQDAIEQFEAGNRQDLVDKEQAQIAILDAYLPEQLSRNEITTAVKAMIDKVGATGAQDKGKVMGPLMAEMRGKADGRLINEIVGELLGN